MPPALHFGNTTHNHTRASPARPTHFHRTAAASAQFYLVVYSIAGRPATARPARRGETAEARRDTVTAGETVNTILRSSPRLSFNV